MPMTPVKIALWSDRAPGALGDGQEDRPTLTAYLPEGAGPHAAVIVCPGGSYCMRAEHEGEPIARWLQTLGIAGIVLDYRVSPYRHPVPLLDAQRAIRLTRSLANEWRIDPCRVGMLGFSAGGHLAASAATCADDANRNDPLAQWSARPDAAILCYPVISFTEIGHSGSIANLIGEHPTAQQIEALSLERRVDAKTPPTFLWHTADDEPVPVENSLVFAQALSHHRVAHELHVFSSGRHGLGLAQGIPCVEAWPDLCAAWLAKLGWAKQAREPRER